MTQVQKLYQQYTQMRLKGQEVKVVLDNLRTPIEALGKPERAELATLLRGWEAQSANTATKKETRESPTQPSRIKPLKSTATAASQN